MLFIWHVKLPLFFRYYINWNPALHPEYFSILNSDIRYTVLVDVWRQDAEHLDVSVQVQILYSGGDASIRELRVYT